MKNEPIYFGDPKTSRGLKQKRINTDIVFFWTAVPEFISPFDVCIWKIKTYNNDTTKKK